MSRARNNGNKDGNKDGNMAGTNDDERAEWADLCAGFHDIRYGAALGFQDEWKACVGETAAGRGSLGRWRALLADIAKANGVDIDFTGRNGAAGDVAGNMRAFLGAVEPAFECPMDMCSRRERAHAGAEPRCDLFDVGMRQVFTTT